MFVKIKDVIIDPEYIIYVRRCRPQPSTILVYTTNSSTAISIDFHTYDDASREINRIADILIPNDEF